MGNVCTRKSCSIETMATDMKSAVQPPTSMQVFVEPRQERDSAEALYMNIVTSLAVLVDTSECASLPTLIGKELLSLMVQTIGTSDAQVTLAPEVDFDTIPRFIKQGIAYDSMYQSPYAKIIDGQWKIYLDRKDDLPLQLANFVVMGLTWGSQYAEDEYSKMFCQDYVPRKARPDYVRPVFDVEHSSRAWSRYNFA